MTKLSLPPLSRYIHVPWCVRKCPYCDFNSHERDDIPEAAYLQQLIADFRQEIPLAQGRALSSIFIGGGTPSLMSGKFYQELFTVMRGEIDFAPDIEITLEANPGTVEQARFDGYRAAGINRLSIGVQSFNPKHLQKLGRIHSSDEAVKAVAAARQAGFDNFNLDLMHGLPEQSQREARDDLLQAIELKPTHLSWYELTIEPNTAFYRAPPNQPDGDVMADIEEEGFALLASHGYQRYEVSAFARAGFQCRHNRNYWEFGDYLAIGAGAHGKITLPERIIRYQKTRLPEHYLACQIEEGFRKNERVLEAEDLPLEFFINALRLVEGVPIEMFSSRTGLNIETLEDALTTLRRRKLLLDNSHQLACSATGMRFLNQVLEFF